MPFDELMFHNRLARPGTIIEVGANKGSMTAHFGCWERQKVVAFEPNPSIYNLLVANMTEAFGSIPDRLSLRREALGAKPGVATLRIPRTQAGVIDEWASLAKTFDGFDGVEFDDVEVPVATIDGFAIHDTTAIKLDAEGYEQEVLIGAKQTIKICRPIISIECEERHRRGCTYFIPGFMEGMNYDGYYYDFKRGEFRPVASFDRDNLQQASASPAEERYGDIYIFVFYFLPKENYELKLELSRCAPIRST